ncbi:MAG: inorganic phosphate transporter, partial [Butyricicoccus sp.]|nr:inorganic phosphate transporter [Butyricicoccus sp.]
MDLSYAHFFEQMSGNPLLTMAVVLTLGVILVNGWTDAPNAIATCVVTRCMPPRAAILMAAVFNFLGVFVMTLLNATVAETITK